MYYVPTSAQSVKTQVNTLAKQEKGILTHIALSYHETICIDLALTGFENMIHQLDQQIDLGDDQRNNDIPSWLLIYDIDHLKAQLRYLKDWFDYPELFDQLRYDGANTVLWPFTSSELVDWLLVVCKSCINHDAIIQKTYDSANGELTDFISCIDEHDQNRCYSLGDDMMYCDTSHWQDYYNDIVNHCELVLVNKLEMIKQQGYPLFPLFFLYN